MPVIIIQVLYWVGSIVSHPIKVDFQPSDILSYWGAFIVATGTVSLGILALYQNHILQKQAEKAQKKIEELEINKTKPILSLSLGIRFGQFSNPHFNLRNKGLGTAYDIKLSDIQDFNDNNYTHIPFQKIEFEQLYAQEKKEIKCEHKGSNNETKWHIGVVIVYTDIHDSIRQAIFHYYWITDENKRVVLERKVENINDI